MTKMMVILFRKSVCAATNFLRAPQKTYRSYVGIASNARKFCSSSRIWLQSTSSRRCFLQPRPDLNNQYVSDWFLQIILRSNMDIQIWNDIQSDLCQFGQAVSGNIYNLHLQCELEQPRLHQYTPWGERIDYIWTSPAWKSQHDISATEGLIGIAYERKYQQYSRIYQMAKLYLYAPSSGLYSCPLAMTDGAAKTIEKLGHPHSTGQAFSRLTSRDPKMFWTSGQWMTEKAGGSDVADGTATTAVRQEDGSYALSGYKWFSSATDSDMALTLARITSKDGSSVPGTKGLSMFYVETRRPDGKLNNIQVIKLKNKLGTRQLPTAELLLEGTSAQLLSEPGKGVSAISHMLAITRIHNSVSAAAYMRRIASLAKDYSLKRKVFGSFLCDHPLHIRTLANMELDTMASAVLCIDLARLLGLEECNLASDQQRLLLRLLTPVAKLYTAKKAVEVVSEGLESFGGQGYIEDTGYPSILRDAQVLPIWEGTTNVLALDVLRAIRKTDGEVVRALVTECRQNITPQLNEKLSRAVNELAEITSILMRECQIQELPARELAFSLAAVYIGTLFAKLLRSNPKEERLVIALNRWCEKDLLPVKTCLAADHYTKAAARDDLLITVNKSR